MGLKNYTTKVPASRSINHIEKLLFKNGATQILKRIDKEKKRYSGISFSIMNNDDILNYELPCDIEGVERVLRSDTTDRTKLETLAKIPDQAERTAWRLLFNWVEIQMAMVTLAQLDIKQVFLSQLLNPRTGKTLYEMVRDVNFQPQLMSG